MTQQNEWLKVESLDLEAQGVAHNTEGKVVFIEGALPGETVKVKITEQKPQYLKAEVQKVLKASEHRIAPLCRFANECGGCQLQHVAEPALTDFVRDRVVGGLEGQEVPYGEVLPALLSPPQSRRRAALTDPQFRSRPRPASICWGTSGCRSPMAWPARPVSPCSTPPPSTANRCVLWPWT